MDVANGPAVGKTITWASRARFTLRCDDLPGTHSFGVRAKIVGRANGIPTCAALRRDAADADTHGFKNFPVEIHDPVVVILFAILLCTDSIREVKVSSERSGFTHRAQTGDNLSHVTIWSSHNSTCSAMMIRGSWCFSFAAGCCGARGDRGSRKLTTAGARACTNNGVIRAKMTGIAANSVPRARVSHGIVFIGFSSWLRYLVGSVGDDRRGPGRCLVRGYLPLTILCKVISWEPGPASSAGMFSMML